MFSSLVIDGWVAAGLSSPMGCVLCQNSYHTFNDSRYDTHEEAKRDYSSEAEHQGTSQKNQRKQDVSNLLCEKNWVILHVVTKERSCQKAKEQLARGCRKDDFSEKSWLEVVLPLCKRKIERKSFCQNYQNLPTKPCHSHI